jgi:hypothetical protein
VREICHIEKVMYKKRESLRNYYLTVGKNVRKAICGKASQPTVTSQSHSLFVISCICYWSRSNWTYIKQFLTKHRSHKTKWHAPERSQVLSSVLWNPFFFYPLNTVKPQGIPSMSTACEFKHLKKRMILEIRVDHNSKIEMISYSKCLR